jgi:hypothetical protein
LYGTTVKKLERELGEGEPSPNPSFSPFKGLGSRGSLSLPLGRGPRLPNCTTADLIFVERMLGFKSRFKSIVNHQGETSGRSLFDPCGRGSNHGRFFSPHCKLGVASKAFAHHALI